MLKAQHRLRRSEDFRLSARRGVRAGRSRLVIHYLPAESTDATRPAAVGLTVSRAVGTAVVRNTVRRRLRHLMAQRTAALPDGSRIVVRALPRAAGAHSSVLAADLDAALDRALTRGGRER